MMSWKSQKIVLILQSHEEGVEEDHVVRQFINDDHGEVCDRANHT